jgi:hypothetical protein
VSEKSNWNLIIIKDPNFLPGKSLYDVIKHCLNVVEFKFVVLDYIYGALTAALAEQEDQILFLGDVLEKLSDVVQFDWGDFFLFKEYPKDWSNPKGELYPFVVVQSDTTVRAVDDQYIYIYTPYQEVVDMIRSNYIVEEIKSGALDQLDYPD